MNIKQEISQGKQALLECEQRLKKINELIESKDNKLMLEFLMDMQKMEHEGRILSIKTRLARIEKEYIVVFERESAEANLYMEEMIQHAMKFVDKEPKNITEQLMPLIRKYEPFMDQEKKNDIFFELKGHIEFLTKKYSRK